MDDSSYRKFSMYGYTVRTRIGALTVPRAPLSSSQIGVNGRAGGAVRI